MQGLSVIGYPQPSLCSEGLLPRCESVIRTKMKRWQQSIKRWTNAVQNIWSFMKMKWISISIQKLAQTGSFTDNKNAW